MELQFSDRAALLRSTSSSLASSLRETAEENRQSLEEMEGYSCSLHRCLTGTGLGLGLGLVLDWFWVWYWTGSGLVLTRHNNPTRA